LKKQLQHYRKFLPETTQQYVEFRAIFPDRFSSNFAGSVHAEKNHFLRLVNIGIPQTRFTIGFSGTATDGFH